VTPGCATYNDVHATCQTRAVGYAAGRDRAPSCKARRGGVVPRGGRALSNLPSKHTTRHLPYNRATAEVFKADGGAFRFPTSMAGARCGPLYSRYPTPGQAPRGGRPDTCRVVLHAAWQCCTLHATCIGHVACPYAQEMEAVYRSVKKITSDDADGVLPSIGSLVGLRCLTHG
jgi:hypothetical protein